MDTANIDRFDAEVVINRVRPAIRADGGDIEVVGVEGADLLVRLLGRCVGCPSAERTLRDGLELRLRRDVPGFGRIIEVH
jgi:Fe-S cluster biogenesis protein NfuA